MEKKIAEVEVWMVVDCDGDFVVAKDESDLDELYTEGISIDASVPRRKIKVVLAVPLPLTTIVRGQVSEIEESTLKEVS